MSRRRFLAGAASASAALVAAACGRERDPVSPLASPSATPTQVGFSSLPPTPAPLPPGGQQAFLPFAAQEGNPAAVALAPSTAEPTATPTAAETPTPTETPTPEPPTPTPTPQATPFPPGPPSKLGLFVSRNVPQIFDLLATQAVTVVKTMELDSNFAAQVKRVAPNTVLIGRIHLDDQLSLATLNPREEAQRFVNALLPYADDPMRRRYFDGWEAYNEPVAANLAEMQRLGDFEAERTRLLGERGIRSVVGNFGTGTPPLELWPGFFPALHAVREYNGWLGLHEYSAPTIYFNSTRADQGRYPGISPSDSGWLTLRYRKVYNEILAPAGLVVPLIMTELGVDGLVTNRPGPPDAMGWHDFQQYWAENGYGLWGPGAYVEQLVWYDAAMRHDSYVVGGCIFVMAASDGWQSYDILGTAAAVLQQYLSVHSAQAAG